VEELKSRFLKLLKEDEEFRYAVAGYIGLSTLIEGQAKVWEEVRKLLEEIVKLREEQKKVWEEIRRMWDVLAKLREDFNSMVQTFNQRFAGLDARLTRVERTLEKIALDIEEEAHVIVWHRIKTEYGVDVKIEPLVLPDLELNLYGVSNDVCIIGEVAVRASVNTLRELFEKLEKLRSNYPEALRPKLVLVVYTKRPTWGLIEEARRRNVWVLGLTADFHKPNLSEVFGTSSR